jgi:DNA-binding CsgD family transcriptional regulator
MTATRSCKWCSYNAPPDLPYDQRDEDGGSLIFDGETLTEPVELLGCPAVDLEMEAFAGRAARELGATGETARKRNVETSSELTAQEAQIVRLVREGLSNPEIAARLFLSPRTVEWHVSRIFGKLNITSRRQLRSRTYQSL